MSTHIVKIGAKYYRVRANTKKIYRKLNVHSRLEVAALANRQKEPSVEN